MRAGFPPMQFLQERFPTHVFGSAIRAPSSTRLALLVYGSAEGLANQDKTQAPPTG
jgi:hypothetical protein